jgi:hypothetical protein
MDTDGEAPLGRYGTSVLSRLDLRGQDCGWQEKAFENAELVKLMERGLVWEMDMYHSYVPRLEVSIFDESDNENPVWEGN